MRHHRAMSLAVVLGSAFSTPQLLGHELVAVPHDTRFGPAVIHHLPDEPDKRVLFRHGAPHRFLPHQIPYRAQAQALSDLGVRSVLLTSSVGVMDKDVPLFEPLLADDLIMLDNRLPDGSQCTMFVEPSPDQGHWVIEGGVFDRALSQQIARLADELSAPVKRRVTFAYVPGPRTKTPAENRLLGRLGGQTNSMTVGPEAVLLGELGLAVAALLVGHKHSLGDENAKHQDVGQRSIDESLARSRTLTEQIALAFLNQGVAVRSQNRLHKLGTRGS